MTDSSLALHEPVEELSEETLETRRGVVSFIEEFEAIDWYAQRIDATKDPQLKSILEHNRDEEKEHAMMALEWLRRRDPVLDEHMRTYLFTDIDIVAAEDAGGGKASASNESLNIGNLRGGH